MDFMARVAIIGGGRRCMLILATLYGEEDIEIVGISDIDPAAPAVSLASELGIFFTTDFHELINRNNINFIINATDNRDISRELEIVKERGISIIDGDVTAFMLDILEKLKRDRTELQHYLERQTRLYESLEQSREYLNKVLNTSADMIVVADREGYITDCNTAAEKMLGYGRDELIGTKASDYWYSPEERMETAERLEREESISNYETRLKRKDGRLIDISLSISLLRDDSNRVIGTVGVSKDITEKKRYEEELKALNERLEEKVLERTRELEAANRELEKSNKLKSQFIANMSHELRTPLNSIIGFSETLLEMPVGGLNEKQERYIRNIHTSGKHLLQLINNILDLAKIEAGRLSLYHEEFLLRPVIEEAVSIVEMLARKKNITIHHDIDKDIGTITADRVKFKQILYNLLSNAIKFTPERGDVYLTADLVTPSEGLGFCSMGEGQRLLRVSVKDTGIGIRPEDMDRIFNEFEQADSSYTRRYEGTGIGLSLTKRLVEMHGGLIRVESRVGEGSIFSFVMPLFERKTEEATDGTVAAPIVPESDYAFEAGPRNTILIVEDDRATSELLTLQLKDAGYLVAHAYDGVEAVKKAVELRPFAIILDVMLPGKDGWEVLQDIRSLPDTKDIPVVVYSIVDNRELGFALGATDYLTKPVDRKTLISKLNELSFTKKRRHQIVNIMVVDDNPEAVELIASMLEPEGFNVIRAYGGREAIEKAEDIRLDAILLDLMMPEMDGFEVVHRLKNMPQTSDVPIFIVTAKDITVEDRLRLAGQIERIYQKSDFTKEDLIRQIKTLELLHPNKAGLIDETSGLFNYAYFQLRLAQEIKRAERYKEALSLLIIDIDRFDQYLSAMGRYHGDVVIRKIAELLRKGLRGSDVIARAGVDEFAIILTNTLKASAVTVARRFKSLIEGYPFYGIDELPDKKLSVSMGIAAFPADASSLEELVSKAYTAMRNARAKGGGQVVTS